VENEGNGWSHDVLTASPGIPGDSGSGFVPGTEPFNTSLTHAVLGL
jgi:hypothetical protein